MFSEYLACYVQFPGKIRLVATSLTNISQTTRISSYFAIWYWNSLLRIYSLLTQTYPRFVYISLKFLGKTMLIDPHTIDNFGWKFAVSCCISKTKKSQDTLKCCKRYKKVALAIKFSYSRNGKQVRSICRQIDYLACLVLS